MTDYFVVKIIFMDGVEENVREVTDFRIDEGVLYLWKTHQFSSHQTHQGSYPLANIRMWKRIDS
jgi:hypothetical protein